MKNLKGSDHWGDLIIDGKIVLNWVLGELGWSARIGFIWLRIRAGAVTGSSEHGNRVLVP
jgi:hypothetical protein